MSRIYLFRTGITHLHALGTDPDAGYRVLDTRESPIPGIYHPSSNCDPSHCVQRLQDLDVEVKADGAFLNSMGFSVSISGFLQMAGCRRPMSCRDRDLPLSTDQHCCGDNSHGRPTRPRGCRCAGWPPAGPAPQRELLQTGQDLRACISTHGALATVRATLPELRL